MISSGHDPGFTDCCRSCSQGSSWLRTTLGINTLDVRGGSKIREKSGGAIQSAANPRGALTWGSLLELSQVRARGPLEAGCLWKELWSSDLQADFFSWDKPQRLTAEGHHPTALSAAGEEWNAFIHKCLCSNVQRFAPPPLHRKLSPLNFWLKQCMGPHMAQRSSRTDSRSFSREVRCG